MRGLLVFIAVVSPVCSLASCAIGQTVMNLIHGSIWFLIGVVAMAGAAILGEMADSRADSGK